MKINGIAHVALTVSRFEECIPFYESLMEFLGLTKVFKGAIFCITSGEELPSRYNAATSNTKRKNSFRRGSDYTTSVCGPGAERMSMRCMNSW